MNNIEELLLKGLRKLYVGHVHPMEMFPRETDPDEISCLIYNKLTMPDPCMIARFGSTELFAISNWWSIAYHQKDYINFIRGKCHQWWWNETAKLNMLKLSGFYPITDENLERFAKMMISDMPLVDVLGSWRPQELFFSDKLASARKVQLYFLEPYWSLKPWSRALEGKNVLVVHPFKETIVSQYNKRENLFKDKSILPRFKSLHVIKAVQSLGGDYDRFTNWFDGLKWMEDEMDKVDYDIALIGCGAYGFPLAAHAKRTGKKAVHLGGALQLLFGIKGRRWEIPTLLSAQGIEPADFYLKLMDNPFWVRASKSETPSKAKDVEDATYW